MKPMIVLILSIAILFSGCTPAAAPLPLPAPTPTSAGSTFQYPETDPVIRLSYDPALTGKIEGALAPAVAASPNLPFTAVHPAYVQVRFTGYAKDQTYQLPYPIEGPQMVIFQTRDFANYGNDSTVSYSNQFDRLSKLIEKGIDPSNCAQPQAGYEKALPFLPLVNSAQVFCAKLQPLTFSGGKGIRYVTYYSQGMGTAVDSFAFYTFQGLTADGQYYVSAVFPIRTNILAQQPPAAGSEPDLKTQAILLKEQVTKINAQANDGFSPSLTALDELISGMSIQGD